MSNIEIRVATEVDVGFICELEKQYPIDTYSMDTIASMFANDYYRNLVIEVDGCVVGYVSATIIYEECNIVKIIVDESHRRQGYATSLLNRIMQEARLSRVDRYYLEVRSDNIPAKNLYEKIGFKKSNTREKYYADGMDADIYWYYVND